MILHLNVSRWLRCIGVFEDLWDVFSVFLHSPFSCRTKALHLQFDNLIPASISSSDSILGVLVIFEELFTRAG
jgi:hypothetical protein